MEISAGFQGSVVCVADKPASCQLHGRLWAGHMEGTEECVSRHGGQRLRVSFDAGHLASSAGTSTNSLFRVQPVADVMPDNRYKKIRQLLYLNDNKKMQKHGDVAYDKLHTKCDLLLTSWIHPSAHMDCLVWHNQQMKLWSNSKGVPA